MRELCGAIFIPPTPNQSSVCTLRRGHSEPHQYSTAAAIARRLEETLATVARMRHAQARYFRTRSQTALRESKALEAKVDALLPPREGAPVQLELGGRDA